MRLIDADRLRHDILNDNTNDPDVVNYYLNMVDGMETAFDMYKVMLQLEAAKELHDDECGFDEFEFLDCDVAIEIVRKGGLEE